MKIDDIWQNGEQPDIQGVNPKDDRKRKGWMHEIDLIKDKCEQLYRKFEEEGKILPWNMDMDESSIIKIKIHQGQNFRVLSNAQGKKISEIFFRLESRRAQLSHFLLTDIQKRGPAVNYRK